MPTILLKKSDTPGSVPGTANLTNLAGGAEVAVNTADKRMFSMTSASAVIELGTNPSSLTCSDGSFVLLKAASASITNLTATSLVLSNLSIASANITTLTSASATITNLVNTSASITTLTNNPTFSAGTANGVLYLNGSKVATSGSALQFSGTNLSLGAAVTSLTWGQFVGVQANYPGVVLSSTASGGKKWSIGADAAVLTFRNETDSSTAAVIDGSNNVGIGTSSPAAKLDVNGAGVIRGFLITTDALKFGGNTSAPSSTDAFIYRPADNTLAFGTANTERARITSGGYSKFSNDGTYVNATSSQYEFRGNTAAALMLFENRHASTPFGLYMDFSAASPDNNSQYFLYAEDSTAARCIIYSDGDLANHDGVYGTISDARLKQDIVDAPSQWDDLKAVRFRKYRMKTDVESDPNAPALLGVVAQELAEVCPGLVDEHPNMKTVEVTDEEGNVTQTQEPDGTTTMTVKSSILLMKAAVALQEAMARIEQLEAKVAALESA